MYKHLLVSAVCLLSGSASPALADQNANVPGAIAGGSDGVTVGGKSVVRGGDLTTGGAVVTGGSSNVFINGKPAATQGDQTSCGGLVVGGNSSVMVNGKPLATGGALTSGCTAN